MNLPCLEVSDSVLLRIQERKLKKQLQNNIIITNTQETLINIETKPTDLNNNNLSTVKQESLPLSVVQPERSSIRCESIGINTDDQLLLLFSSKDYNITQLTNEYNILQREYSLKLNENTLQIEMQKQDIRQYQLKCEKQENKIRFLSEESDLYQQIIKQLKNEKQVQTNEIQELSNKYNPLLQEYKRLKIDFDHVNNNNMKLKTELDNGTQENEWRENKFKDLINELRNEISRLKHEKESLKEKYAKETSELGQKLFDQANNLQKQTNVTINGLLQQVGQSINLNNDTRKIANNDQLKEEIKKKQNEINRKRKQKQDQEMKQDRSIEEELEEEKKPEIKPSSEPISKPIEPEENSRVIPSVPPTIIEKSTFPSLSNLAISPIQTLLPSSNIAALDRKLDVVEKKRKLFPSKSNSTQQDENRSSININPTKLPITTPSLYSSSSSAAFSRPILANLSNNFHHPPTGFMKFLSSAAGSNNIKPPKLKC